MSFKSYQVPTKTRPWLASTCSTMPTKLGSPRLSSSRTAAATSSWGIQHNANANTSQARASIEEEEGLREWEG